MTKEFGLKYSNLLVSRVTNDVLFRHPLLSVKRVDCPLVLVVFCFQAIFPRTPLAGSHQTAVCSQLHGPLTPGRISVGRPHCVIPFHGGCDWTEVSLSPVPVLASAGSNPDFAALVLIALPLGVFADRLPGLELITPTQGMCLMNVYSIFKVLKGFPGSLV